MSAAEIATREDLRHALKTQTLRLTVRMATVVAAAAGLLFAGLQIFPA